MKHLFEDENFADEPYKPGKEGSTKYGDMIHDKTVDLQELYDQLVTWRALMDYYKQQTGRTR